MESRRLKRRAGGGRRWSRTGAGGSRAGRDTGRWRGAAGWCTHGIEQCRADVIQGGAEAGERQVRLAGGIEASVGAIPEVDILFALEVEGGGAVGESLIVVDNLIADRHGIALAHLRRTGQLERNGDGTRTSKGHNQPEDEMRGGGRRRG